MMRYALAKQLPGAAGFWGSCQCRVMANIRGALNDISTARSCLGAKNIEQLQATIYPLTGSVRCERRRKLIGGL
jgi:hypothetical protein